eukprot:SAG31_NODE_2939_length_4883_cov_6.368102_1_plen_121_part_00
MASAERWQHASPARTATPILIAAGMGTAPANHLGGCRRALGPDLLPSCGTTKGLALATGLTACATKAAAGKRGRRIAARAAAGRRWMAPNRTVPGKLGTAVRPYPAVKYRAAKSAKIYFF